MIDDDYGTRAAQSGLANIVEREMGSIVKSGSQARLQLRHRLSTSESALKVRFDTDMQHGPNYGGGELKIIAAILGRPVIEKILTDLDLDPQPPPEGWARQAAQDFAA